MKKILFLLAAAATCAACSMDETTEVDQGLPIDFRTAVGTRATEITTSDLEKFKVAAFYSEEGNTFFEETEIDITGDGSSKTGESTYYWPSDDSELIFYAYAPTDLSSKGGKITMTDKSSSTIEYTPATDITNQIDLIAVTATGKRSVDEETGVQLTFQHALSQIEVQADYANAESDGKYTIEVAGVRIGNVSGFATYTFSESAGYGSWSSEADTKNYDVEYTDSPVSLDATAKSIMGSESSATTNGTWMLIPQTLTAWEGTSENTGTYLAAYIKITTKEGHEVYPATEDSEYGWAAVGIDTEWEPNHKYTYTLHFTDDSAGNIPPDPEDNPDAGKPVLGAPIKFTVTVDSWNTEGGEIDVPETE